MSTVVLLFVLGLILLGFEVFLPGAILGIFGGLALLGASAVAWLEFGATAGFLTFLLAVATVVLLLVFEFKILPRTRLGRRLFLTSTISGRTHESAEGANLIGQTGQAETPLAPTGYVLIGGRRYEAYSEAGYLPAGVPVRVVRFDNFRIIITQA